MVSAAALKAGKATITVTSTSNPSVSATCEITVIPATGIDSVIAEENIASGNVYTINGVKVLHAGESLNKLSKGLYIINGKKVVVK
ncbi:MAG: hypothetical protein U0K35_03550 [Prevotella sp.]|nr:hypothetical protein [Prevotella sp.]